MRLEILGLFAGMAAVTYFTRFGSLALLKRTGIPDWFERWFEHVPTAILTALIVPALLAPETRLDISWHNHYLLAGIVASLVAYKTKNAFLTMVIGMGVMLTLRWLVL
ncbi:MAG: AzlD domain-containing protein [Ignavibacteriales bacterium]